MRISIALPTVVTAMLSLLVHRQIYMFTSDYHGVTARYVLSFGYKLNLISFFFIKQPTPSYSLHFRMPLPMTLNMADVEYSKKLK